MLRSAPYAVAIDFETAARSGPCACAVGMAGIENGQITRKFYSLIKPPNREVLFSEIHGLYWDDLKDAPSFADLWSDMRDFIGEAQFLIAHNAQFDKNVLKECCKAAGYAMPAMPFLCTLRGARAKLSLPSYRLSALADHFMIPLTHHHASSDAIACAMIYLELLKLGVSHSAMKLPEKGFVFPREPPRHE